VRVEAENMKRGGAQTARYAQETSKLWQDEARVCARTEQRDAGAFKRTRKSVGAETRANARYGGARCAKPKALSNINKARR